MEAQISEERLKQIIKEAVKEAFLELFEEEKLTNEQIKLLKEIDEKINKGDYSDLIPLEEALE